MKGFAAPRPRRPPRRPPRLVLVAAVLGVAFALLILALASRRPTPPPPQQQQSQPGATSASSLASSESGAQLLLEQQEQHLGDSAASALQAKDGRVVKLNLKGAVSKPRPPGWPFDPMDYPKPRTFFDIEIDGKPAGRIVFELFTKQAPRLAENFRALCTGEKGRVQLAHGGEGRPLHYKGAHFYRVINRFICQTGIDTPSIYGGEMDDDPLALLLKHDRKGLLSAANHGPNTTTTHFSIVVAPAPHLNRHYPIFGQVVDGLELVDKINALAKPHGSNDEQPRLPVIVSNSGELLCNEKLECKEVTFNVP